MLQKLFTQKDPYIIFLLVNTNLNRGFPKVDHSDRSARIVLEQINSAKEN